MNKSIGSIAWPPNPRDSAQLFLRYMLRVLEELSISFSPPSNDPMSIVTGVLAERLSEGDRLRALAYWWNVVDARGIRNFEDKNALLARLAVCLLSSDEAEVSNFGEQLSWFLEVLGFFGADVDRAISIMEKHFDFTEGKNSPAPRETP